MKKIQPIETQPIETEVVKMFKIEIDLQNNQRAVYQFTDRNLARNVFEQTRFVGAIGNLGIRDIRFYEQA